MSLGADIFNSAFGGLPEFQTTLVFTDGATANCMCPSVTRLRVDSDIGQMMSADDPVYVVMSDRIATAIASRETVTMTYFGREYKVRLVGFKDMAGCVRLTVESVNA